MKKYAPIVMLVATLFGGLFFISKDDLIKHFLFGQIATAVPFSPYGLGAVITNYNQVDLSWVDDPVNKVSGRDAEEFKLYRRTAYTGSWSLIKTTTGTTYTQMDVAPGSYEYRVVACNDLGCSGDSNLAAINLAKDTIRPSAPESFSVPQKEVKDTEAYLYWAASTDDIGIRQYNIYRSPASANNFSFIASVSSGQFNYTDTGLSPVTNYYYHVKAVDFAKNESDQSNILNIITLPLATTKGYIRVVSPNGGECFQRGSNLPISWTGVDFNKAKVYYGGDLIYTGTAISYDWFINASVSATGAGSVKVVALDENGVEGISDINDAPFTVSLDCQNENISPVLIPAVPTYFRAYLIPNTRNIGLTWQDNSKNESEFRLYRRSLPDGKWQTLAILPANTVFYTDSEIPPGDYEYDTNACNSSGCSAYSNTYKITAHATLPVDNSKVYKSSDLKQGDIISATGSDDPDIYIINESGYKRLFLNPVIFNFYGHLGGFQNVKQTDSSTRDFYKTSGIFRNCEINDEKIYGVELTGEDAGTLHWINTSGDQAVADDPDFFKKVFCINTSEFNWYQKGSEYSSVKDIPSYSR